MPSYCSAYGCRNSGHKDRPNGEPGDISFHMFPLRNPELLTKWLMKLRRVNFCPNKHSKLCSVHFEKNCFLQTKSKGGRRILKPNAVPTRFAYLGSGDEEKVYDVRHSLESKRRNTVNKFEKYFKSIDTSCQSEKDDLLRLRDAKDSDEEENDSDDSDSSSEGSLNNVSLEDYMNENLPKHSKNGPIEEKIGAMRSKLMATVMKRALQRSLLESEIKSAHARRAYFDSKKSFLTPTNTVKSSSGMPISFNDIKVFEDLKLQVMNEELAAKTEKRVLQKQLFEAEIQAATSKRGYYSAKKSTLLVPNDT